MRTVVCISSLLGLAWNFIAVWLMGGKLADALSPSWMLAGAMAGIAAGVWTVRCRIRRDGNDRFVDGLTTYYLGMVTYWFCFVVIQRVILCVKHGGWTDFDLRDHLTLIVNFLILGTFWHGLILIPLCFLTRRFVWSIYLRSGD